MTLEQDCQLTAHPYLFIVGSARSGTTLLRRIVDTHSHIAVTPETHWITRFYRDRVGLSEDDNISLATIDALLAHKRFPDLDIDPEEVRALLPANHSLSYSDFVSSIFELYRRRKNKPLVADKTPPYVRKIGLLSRLFPNALFLHQIRDGRDVCLSMMTWRFLP